MAEEHSHIAVGPEQRPDDRDEANNSARVSLFQLSGLPLTVGVIVLTIALGVALSPYVAGTEIGSFRFPSFSATVSEALRIASPFIAFLLPCLFLPLFTRRALTSIRSLASEGLAFSAIRVSGQDESWITDGSPKETSKQLSKPFAEYPFSKPFGYRLTCWRSVLLGAGADPVLDVALANRSNHFFLVTKVGIEIVSVGCVTERRDTIGMPEPVRQRTRGCIEVLTPDVMPMFQAARERSGDLDVFEFDPGLTQSTELGEPFYLKPQRTFRFELRLMGFCERIPLHSLMKLVVQTDRGLFRSPTLYFRR